MTTDQRLLSERFPRSSRYHPDWIIASVSGGANSLWMTEWLAGTLDLHPGMRVLDLGCGRAASSIFMRREFGVEVWATDLWFSASENLLRIRDAGVEDGVFPIHADARSLPFAAEFFDAVVSIDSFVYYGTDDLYLSLPRPAGEARRSIGDRRGRTNAGDQWPGSRSSSSMVGAKPLVPALAGVVAAALGANRHCDCGTGRHHTGRMAALAGMAAGGLPRQRHRTPDRGSRSR